MPASPPRVGEVHPAGHVSVTWNQTLPRIRAELLSSHSAGADGDVEVPFARGRRQLFPMRGSRSTGGGLRQTVWRGLSVNTAV